MVWTLADNQNTVRDLATYSSGVTTTVVNHRVFSAYGQLLSQTNPSNAARRLRRLPFRLHRPAAERFSEIAPARDGLQNNGQPVV